jgi:hypothetical protein
MMVSLRWQQGRLSVAPSDRARISRRGAETRDVSDLLLRNVVSPGWCGGSGAESSGAEAWS